MMIIIMIIIIIILIIMRVNNEIIVKSVDSVFLNKGWGEHSSPCPLSS